MCGQGESTSVSIAFVCPVPVALRQRGLLASAPREIIPIAIFDMAGVGLAGLL